MAEGDHLYVLRGLYIHHGVDMGDGWIIHFSSSNGTKDDATIRWAQLDEFGDGGTVQVRSYGVRFDADQAMDRARSMIGKSGYDLFANNCEHFATWCVTGEHSSAQVEAASSSACIAGVWGVGPSLGLGVVTLLGEAAPMSGPNLMSGLATVGGGVVGGVALLGGAAGVLAGGGLCIAIRDKSILADEERQARRAGRYGAMGGAALGVGAAVCAVGAMGVTGYSAPGLTSGLAGLGRVAGGGMAKGVLVAVLLPALFAVAAGYLTYRLAGLARPRTADPAGAIGWGA